MNLISESQVRGSDLLRYFFFYKVHSSRQFMFQPCNGKTAVFCFSCFYSSLNSGKDEQRESFLDIYSLAFGQQSKVYFKEKGENMYTRTNAFCQTGSIFQFPWKQNYISDLLLLNVVLRRKCFHFIIQMVCIYFTKL